MYIIVNHSAVETKFKCSGSIVNQHYSESTNIYIKLLHYRPWVKLWADSDGSISVEVPETWAHFYSNIREDGSRYQIMNSRGGVEGSFSASSNTLALISPYGFFNGTCTEIQ